MRSLIAAAAAAACLAGPAFADQTSGHVLAYDRVANILVLTDNTVWQIPGDILIPADLVAGDRVVLDYASEGEDGIARIDGLARVARMIPEGSDGGS